PDVIPDRDRPSPGPTATITAIARAGQANPMRIIRNNNLAPGLAACLPPMHVPLISIGQRAYRRLALTPDRAAVSPGAILPSRVRAPRQSPGGECLGYFIVTPAAASLRVRSGPPLVSQGANSTPSESHRRRGEQARDQPAENPLSQCSIVQP